VQLSKNQTKALDLVGLMAGLAVILSFAAMGGVILAMAMAVK